MTLPLFSSGNELMRTAVFVLKIIAAPMPCIILTAVIINAETEKNAAAQQTENTAIPVINIFLLSYRFGAHIEFSSYIRDGKIKCTAGECGYKRRYDCYRQYWSVYIFTHTLIIYRILI